MQLRHPYMVATVTILSLAMIGCGSSTSRAAQAGAQNGDGNMAEGTSRPLQRSSSNSLADREVVHRKLLENQAFHEPRRRAAIAERQAAPELPQHFAADTQPGEMRSHALIAAQADVLAGTANGMSVEERQAYYLEAWTPQQAKLRAEAEAQRIRVQERHAAKIEAIQTHAQWERRLERIEAAYREALRTGADELVLEEPR